MVTFSDVQRAAAAAIADYKKRSERIDEFLVGVEEFAPERKARLLGEFPAWASYVLQLGEPGRGLVTPAHAHTNLGSSKNIRALALALLVIADNSDPIDEVGP